MRNPKETSDKYINIGIGKAQIKKTKAFILALFAGVFIAFAGVASTFAGFYTNKLCGAMIFCGGLSMVLVAGSELFTGNVLLIMPLMEKKIKFREMILNWIIVYAGNFIGGLIVAALAVYSGALDGVAEAVVSTAAAKASLPFFTAFAKGIFCNFLVCIAVWMSFTSDKTGDKILAVLFPVTMFVLCGFEHSIANMYYIPAGLFMNIRSSMGADITIKGMLVNNLLFVTLGNLVGGGSVAIGYSLVYRRK